MDKKTYNFRLEDYKHKIEYDGEFVDRRNGIICVSPTADEECYINYLDYLNSHMDKWRNYGYLDLGMMPVAMAPSFMQYSWKEGMFNLLRVLDIPAYVLPPVSLLYEECRLQERDIWVFKEDAAKCIGWKRDPKTLQFKTFFEEVNQLAKIS